MADTCASCLATGKEGERGTRGRELRRGGGGGFLVKVDLLLSGYRNSKGYTEGGVGERGLLKVDLILSGYRNRGGNEYAEGGRGGEIKILNISILIVERTF